jgi:hypothetical protein
LSVKIKKNTKFSKYEVAYMISVFFDTKNRVEESMQSRVEESLQNRQDVDDLLTEEKVPKTLLDYLVLSELSEEGKSVANSDLYTKDGTFVSLPKLQPLPYCAMIKETFPYDEAKLGEVDVWKTCTRDGCNQRSIIPNEDKINYLIQYYVERGGDTSVYPFSNDTEETRKLYEGLATWHGQHAIEESRIRSIFTSAGIEDGKMTIDAKGVIKVEAQDADMEVVNEKLDNLTIRQAIFTRMVYSNSRYSHFSDERINKLYTSLTVRRALYLEYNTKLEDLSVSENGSILGLPEGIREDYKGGWQYFYPELQQALAKGGSSDAIVATITYKNGELYIH